MLRNLFNNRWLHILTVCSLMAFTTSCGDDDEDSTPEESFTPQEKSYSMNEVDVDGITGTLTFTENEDGSTTVTIALQGVSEGAADAHPAHIHSGPAALGGGIDVSLEPVDNTTGMSETTVTETDGGEALSYEDLEMYNGYVNVHLSGDDLGTIVAQVDIGVNELTGESEVYTLDAADVNDVSGTATFFERANGATLVELMVEGDAVQGDHPAHIHEGPAEEAPGDIFITFTNVNSEGMSATHISTEEMSYQDLIMYDGYINVHASPEDLGTIVVQGNIGSNVE